MVTLTPKVPLTPKVRSPKVRSVMDMLDGVLAQRAR